MRITVKILLIAAALTAGTSATRADDLSDLVAAVATGKSVVKESQDMLTVRLDTLNRYTPAKGDVTKDMLDDIFVAMTMQSSFDYILRNYDPELNRDDDRRVTDGRHYRPTRPTLARRDFYRPVPGMITSFYGWRPQFNRLHHGIDLKLNIGDTVRAARSGIVEKIAYDHKGYGHYVVVTHPDGMQTLYGHLQYALVGQGQTVYAGYPIAIGGNTGNSTGPHLHFEARLGGVAIDPTLIFDFYGRGGYMASDSSEEELSDRNDPKSLKGKRTYIVRQGDTPKSIAKRAGISVATLCRLNMIMESAPLEIGRMLKIR